MDTLPEVVEYWNKRSLLGEMAGTKDLPAKQLEMKTLAECFPNDSTETVVDMGCGNGMTSVFLKHARPGMTITGVDNSPGMVKAATNYATNIENVDVKYVEGSVLTWRPESLVDAIYTERTLINLPDWDAQRAAIFNILQCLKRGGKGTYLMMENSADGLKQINTWREAAGLPLIEAPWHNHYINDHDIGDICDNQYGYLLSIINYSGPYYFISRVVTAWIAKELNQEPRYDAKTNQLGSLLPQIPGLKGQGRLWVWRTK